MNILVSPIRLLGCAMALASGLACAGSWVPSGPPGGGRYVATHPLVGGQAMIVADYGSLSTWFTGDGGAHWTGNPWRDANGKVALAGAPTVAWMAGGPLMRSVDQGRSWAPVRALVQEHVGQLAANPSDGDEVLVAADSAMFHTRDGGATWIYGPRPGEEGPVRSMAVDWSTRALFVAVESPDAHQPLWRRPLDSPEAWTTSDITARCVGAARGIVLVGDADGRLLRSTDAGATFVPVAQALGPLELAYIAFAVAPSKRVYAVRWTTAGARLLRSDDEGATWSATPATPDPSVFITSISVDATNADTIYVSTSEGVLVSVDGGTSLQALARPTGAPGSTRLVASDVADPARLWAYPPLDWWGNVDGMRSSDGGATWSVVSPDRRLLGASRKRANTVFAALVRRSSFGVPWSFDVSADGGDSWTPKIVSPVAGPAPVAFGPVGYGAVAGEIYVPYATQDAFTGLTVLKVFASLDDGGTFVERSAPPLYVKAMASSATVPTVLYAAGFGSEPGTAQLWRSTDAAHSWQPVHFFPLAWGASSFGNEIFAVAVDPTDPNRLYAGFSLPDQLMRSVDGGVTWTRATTGLGAGGVTSIVVDPSNPSTIYAGQYPSGVFRSTDYGQTWTALDEGLRDDSVRQVALDPHHSGRLYAGTDSGIWRVDLSTGVPAGRRRAIEFYHSEMDHYVVSADLDEIAGLDAGAFVGWLRTGEGFRVAEGGAPGNDPVCRFFGTGFAPKSSHFYTPYASECEIAKSDPNWQYEKIAFGLVLPDASTRGCPPNTRPLYRAWNRNAGGAPNHRYDTDFQSMQNSVLRQGWILEGDEATLVFACVPT